MVPPQIQVPLFKAVPFCDKHTCPSKEQRQVNEALQGVVDVAVQDVGDRHYVQIRTHGVSQLRGSAALICRCDVLPRNAR